MNKGEYTGNHSLFLFRHIGDLGNLFSDVNGRISKQFMDDKVSLFGPFSVIGRAFVVRSKQVQLDVPALGLGRVIARDANHAGSCGKGALNHSLLTLRVPKPFYLTSETKITTGFKCPLG